MTNIPNQERKTLILTGASRGIGHATVKRFSSAGWRVITCSRHAFPEDCPWEAGPEDHIQVDLSDTANTEAAIAEMRERLKDQGGRLNALVNNAAISPKGEGGVRLGSIDTTLALFQEWMDEAKEHEPNDPNAMGLATVDADGLPNLRMVLLKEADADGFVFYTNEESAKGRELEANPKAALCFHWKSLRRQVRVRGTIEKVADYRKQIKGIACRQNDGSWSLSS